MEQAGRCKDGWRMVGKKIHACADFCRLMLIRRTNKYRRGEHVPCANW